MLVKVEEKNPGTTLKRSDEVFHCWFESGSMPYAQKHYPFENANKWQEVEEGDLRGKNGVTLC